MPNPNGHSVPLDYASSERRPDRPFFGAAAIGAAALSISIAMFVQLGPHHRSSSLTFCIDHGWLVEISGIALGAVGMTRSKRERRFSLLAVVVIIATHFWGGAADPVYIDWRREKETMVIAILP